MINWEKIMAEFEKEIASWEVNKQVRKHLIDLLKGLEQLIEEENSNIFNPVRWKEFLEENKRRIKKFSKVSEKDFERFYDFVIKLPSKTNVFVVQTLSKKSHQTIGQAIGKVSLSQYTPSTPTQFHFWIKNDKDIHVEPGSLVAIRESNKKIVAIVQDVKAYSDIQDPVNEFYSSGYGDPNAELSVERPVIRVANAHIVKRSDDRVEPLIKNHLIYFANQEEIISAYSGSIPEKRRILVGFTEDSEKKEPIPVFADADYIFGYKGAHINIAGASGLAAKTSYAIFLILSVLSLARKNEKLDIGIVAFNVKEKDLLRIKNHKFKNFKQVYEELEKKKDFEKSISLWKKCEELDIDPFNINVTIFEPGKDFMFGLSDIIELGEKTPEILRMFFDPADINDNFEALLSGIVEDYYYKGKYSFNEMLDDLKEKRKPKGQTKKSDQVTVGGIPIHIFTLDKFIRRFEVAKNQLSSIIDFENFRAHLEKLIPIHNLKPGNIFIIDIEPLSDRGKRVVFLSILKAISKILEAKRAGEETVELWGEPKDISNFPSRIAIFIDELNKFAPRGREFSPIKSPIIDIAARGRSIGLSLIGAEQMASQIDEQVLANCSTFVVGRAHPIEIREKSYEWLQGDLRSRVTILKPGEVIMFHAVHNAPVLLRFPIPFHHIEIEEEVG